MTSTQTVMMPMPPRNDDDDYHGPDRRVDHDPHVGIRELHEIKDDIEAKMDRMEDQIVTAMNGMRDRHHQSMNDIAGELGKQQVSIMALTGRMDVTETSTKAALGAMQDGMSAMRFALEKHVEQPGHEDTMRWRAGLQAELKSWTRRWSLLGTLTSGIVTGTTVGIVVWVVTKG